MSVPHVFNLALWFTIAFGLSILSSKIYRARTSPLRNVQGPWLARFTRFWYAKSSYSRQGHKIIMDLHAKYGPIVRVAPNEYSIDNYEAAKIIYRTRDPLVKVCWVFPEPPRVLLVDRFRRRRGIQAGVCRMQSLALSLVWTIRITQHAYDR